jgi:hypothetical protein
MVNMFSRSWEIMKLSFNVLKADKELLLFPLLSGFFSLLFMIAMVFPMLLPMLFDGAGMDSIKGVLNYILIFLVYLGLAFIATFFNVCVVYTTKTRFNGGDATFMDSIRFAFSKIHLIFSWSLIAATVGLILKALTNFAERLGPIGGLISKIMISILGMGWSIITLFVVPGMVYHNLGPIQAIKKSAQVLRKTWGESLIRHFGLGLAQFIFLMLGFIVTIVLIIISAVIDLNWLIMIWIPMFVLYIVFVFLFFGIMNSIFNTALYVYADTGNVPQGFNKEVMQSVFTPKKVK